MALDPAAAQRFWRLTAKLQNLRNSVIKYRKMEKNWKGILKELKSKASRRLHKPVKIHFLKESNRLSKPEYYSAIWRFKLTPQKRKDLCDFVSAQQSVCNSLFERIRSKAANVFAGLYEFSKEKRAYVIKSDDSFTYYLLVKEFGYRRSVYIDISIVDHPKVKKYCRWALEGPKKAKKQREKA